jgi:serine/threonine protein phosphatase PrpC
MSRGFEGPARKLDPNEDSCGFISGGIGSIAVVADGHYGRSSAELAVDQLLHIGLQEPPPRGVSGQLIWEWLQLQLESANSQVRAEPSASACAILAVVVQGHMLWWASIGDCRLYHLRGSHSAVCNPLHGVYLGDSAQVSPELGELSLAAGDRVVLASDGLPECIHGQETLLPSDVLSCVRDQAPEPAARALIDAALTGGGEDNVSVVVGQI